MLQCKKQKNPDLYGAIDELSKHNISLKNYIGVSYLFVDVAAALRAVKMYQKRSKLAIKLINDVPQRYSVVYFVCDTYFERSIITAEKQ